MSERAMGKSDSSTGGRAAFWGSVGVSVWLSLALALVGGRGCRGDETIGRALHAGTHDAVIQVAKAVTWIGGWELLSGLAILGAVYLSFRGRGRCALTLLVTAFGGRAAVAIAKVLAGRDRPSVDLHLVTTDSMSFPSGHSANAVITLLAVALLVPERGAGRGLAATLAIILAFAVGVSRVMLGVHWATDVLGGWAFGALWTLVCLRVIEPFRRRAR